jgi:hypothetical protein
MTEKTEKSIQELREEIDRLEQQVRTEAQKRTEAEVRLRQLDPTEFDRLEENFKEVSNDRNLLGEQLAKLRRDLAYALRLCGDRNSPGSYSTEELSDRVVKKIMQLDNIRLNCIAEVKDLTNQAPLIDSLKKERDEIMMRALDAERKVRDLSDLLSQHENGERLRKAEAAAAEAVRTRDIAAKDNTELRKDVVNQRYTLQQREQELEELKARHAELQARNEDREWAAENKNAYDSLLALRDTLAPTVPLQDACRAVQAVIISEKMEVQRLSDSIAVQAHQLHSAEQEAKHEKFLKDQIYGVYAELRRLFNLEHVGSIDVLKVHAVIKGMLDRCSQETQQLLEKLEKERALACTEIRRLQEELGLAKS